MDDHRLLREIAENLMLFMQLGFSIAAPPVLCLYAANWLRGALDLGIWIMVAALALGLGGAVVSVRRLWKMLRKRWDSDKSSGR